MFGYRPFHDPDAVDLLDMLAMLAFLGPLVIGTWTVLVYVGWLILAWSGVVSTHPSFWSAVGIATVITVARLALTSTDE